MSDSSSQLESDIEDSSQSESAVEPSFARFNNLPIEVRLMIWKEALPGPRIVYLEPMERPNETYFPVRSDVAIDDNDEEGYSRFFDPEWEIDIETVDQLRNEGDRFQCLRYEYYLRGFRTRAPPPVLLYVCHESFQVTCKNYERVFGTTSAMPDVWFNFEIDTLYLDWAWPIESWRPFYYEGWFADEELERVKYLAFYHEQPFIPNAAYACEEEVLAQKLRAFPNAKKVTLNRLHRCHAMADNDSLVFANPPLPEMRFYVPNYFAEDEDVSNNLYHTCIYGARLDLEALERWRLESYELTDASLLPPLPEFDYRMITTPYIKAELIKAEAEWREEMATLPPFEPPPF